MADRSIKVSLRANVQDFTAQMKASARSLEEVAKAADKTGQVASTRLGRLAQSARLQRQDWDRAGTALFKFGTVTTGALAASVKAASDWESAFAGVRKTVDMSEAGYVHLADSLREMTGQVSASHEEIAAVAENAGQLGIANQHIVDFTRTMIDLGEATNLTAEEGATQLARFANVTGMAQSKFSNLGSSVVELGNNYATTESEIVAMGTRLAGAGSQIGMTEGQIMGLSAALSSVGVEAEAGGSAMSRVMVRMRGAVDSGGKSLESFARVAGMTGSQFQTLFKQDSAGALTAFVQGLSRIEEQGGSMQPVLEELGMTDLRVADALRRAAGASDLFASAMKTGESAFQDNTALAKEAAQRYETTGARAKMAWNQIKDAGISLGDSMLPVVANVADGVAGLASGFADLPQPVQTATASLMGIVGAGALVTGGFLKLAPAVLDGVEALQNLGIISGNAAGALGKVGKAAGKIAAAGAAIGVLTGLMKTLSEATADVPDSFETLTQNMLRARDAGGGVKDIFDGFTIGAWKWKDALVESDAQFKNLVNSLHELKTGDSLSGMIFDIEQRFGIGAQDVNRFDDALQQVGKTMAALPAGEAAQTFNQMVDAMGGGHENAQKLLDLLPEYRAHLKGIANEAGVAATDQELLAMATGEAAIAQDEAGNSIIDTTGAIEDQSTSIDELISQHMELAGVVLGERSAQRDFQEALDEAQQALEENGATLDIHTEKGRANQAALDGIASAGLRAAEAMVENGASAEEVAAQIASTRSSFIEMATSMGLPQAQAEILADKLGLIPEDVQVFIEAHADEANSEIEGVKTRADTTQGDVKVGADTSQATSQIASAAGSASNVKGKFSVSANTAPATQDVLSAQCKINDSTSEFDVKANTSPAKSSASQAKSSIERNPATVTVVGRDNLTGPVWSWVNSLPSTHTITINTVHTGDGHATGGPVYGPGGPTSDSVPALLSAGEHVMTAREVQGLGGHDNVFRLRAMARNGSLRGMLGFANGGTPLAVNPSVNVTAPSTPVGVSLDGQEVRLVLDDGVAFNAHLEQVADGRIVEAQRVRGRKR